MVLWQSDNPKQHNGINPFSHNNNHFVFHHKRLPSNSSALKSTATSLIYGSKSPLLESIKNFAILICFHMAFLCKSIRKPQFDCKVVEQKVYLSNVYEDKMPNEPGKELGGSDYVMCRIYEDKVPLSHLETPFALTGSHNLAKATAKGNTLFVMSATEKQWQSSQKTLQSILDSFQL